MAEPPGPERPGSACDGRGPVGRLTLLRTGTLRLEPASVGARPSSAHVARGSIFRGHSPCNAEDITDNEEWTSMQAARSRGPRTWEGDQGDGAGDEAGGSACGSPPRTRPGSASSGAGGRRRSTEPDMRGSLGGLAGAPARPSDGGSRHRSSSSPRRSTPLVTSVQALRRSLFERPTTPSPALPAAPPSAPHAPPAAALSAAAFTRLVSTGEESEGQGLEEEVATPLSAGSSSVISPTTGRRPRRQSVSRNAHDVIKECLGGQSFSLKTWLQHFDKNMNGRIDFQEFQAGLLKLNYKEDNIIMLWQEMDADCSGEITFDEIDSEQALMWSSFRRWCGTKFLGPRDMILKLKEAYASRHNLPTPPEEEITDAEFQEGLQHFGWNRGFVSHLFSALEFEDRITAKGLEWVKAEVKRYKQKEEAKKKAQRMTIIRASKSQVAQHVLNNFKNFLRRTFGNLFRAWRRALDTDGTMTVQKAELYKVCRQLNWKGDVRALWQALDHDASGLTTLEEFDPCCAQVMAQFKEWLVLQCGHKTSAYMFAALDRGKRRKLTYAQFIQECEARGFTRKVKNLAVWLDWQDKKYLIPEDFAIFDCWRPPAWLTAKPNMEAANEFRRVLLAKYGTLLKGWRVALDKDNSNCMSWHEFKEACKYLKLSTDVAGAWLALDEDVSGFITLKEIDEETHNVLMEFKAWAEEEFGSVKAAFKIMDKDNSGGLTYKEFRGACRNYGYNGDTKKLFYSLDTGKEGNLLYKEICFLDDWELQPEAPAPAGAPELPDMLAAATHQEAAYDLMLDYGTPVPGPGAYNVPCSFGITERVPGARHAGAFSFAPRTNSRRGPRTVGPANYNPSLQATTSRKPAWSFGGSTPRRPGTATSQGGASPASASTPRGPPAAERPSSPGPGAYELRTTFEGPKYSMRPRRRLHLHPQQSAIQVR